MRVMLFDRNDTSLGELSLDEIYKLVRHEVINGEHEMTLETSRILTVGTRILMRDGTGRWREYVASEPDEEHEKGEHAIGTYVCMWSLQYDLSTTYDDTHREPGVGANQTSSNYAVECAIKGTDRWERGSCTAPDVGQGKGCVLMFESAWDRLSEVVDTWGGEVDAEITVDANGIVSRKVVLLAHVGSQDVTRRFDWGHDLTSIRRTPDPGPYFCRVVPIGKTHQEWAVDDETEIDWPLRLTDDPEYYPEYTVNYIEDPDAALAFRVPDGDGGWEYPTKVVKYDADDVELLYNACTEDLHNHTRPGVTYEANVVQFAEAGMDAQGVSLGDNVHCVDSGFNPDAPLRLEGRVVEIEVDELNPKTGTELKIGQLGNNLSSMFSSLVKSAIGSVSNRLDRIDGRGTIVYLQNLLDYLNAEINATGGYVYIVNGDENHIGQGLITYDIAVDDPLIGYNSATQTWASHVTQIKGGSIRIADTKKPAFAGIGDWDWKTVFTSGHIASELVTAAQITAGYIGSSSGGNYWNLDDDELYIGGKSSSAVSDAIDATITAVDVEYAEAQSASTAPQSGWSTAAPSWRDGYYIWSRVKTVTPSGATYSSPTCISGRDGVDGTNGTNGVGITSIEEQYYLSTSNSTQTGGSWSANQPTWTTGTYIWTRSAITWDTTPSSTTYTTPVLASALTQANSTAKSASDAATEAAKTATNYLSFNSTNGLDIGYSGTSAKTRVNGSGVEIYDGSGTSRFKADTSSVRVGISTGRHIQIDANGIQILNNTTELLQLMSTYSRFGKSTEGHIYVNNGGYLEVRDGSDVLAHIGSNGSSGNSYYTLGTRSSSNSTVGNQSFCVGKNNLATAIYTIAMGNYNTASGKYSIAIGYDNTVSGEYSMATGSGNNVDADLAFVSGIGCDTNPDNDSLDRTGIAMFGKYLIPCFDAMVVGKYNANQGIEAQGLDEYMFVIGVGTSNSNRKNGFYINKRGDGWFSWTCSAQGFTTRSDRRLKEHVAYLEDDADEFIRSLKPARFKWRDDRGDGHEHMGFYAQDVAEAEPESWDTETVRESNTSQDGVERPLTLDYQAIIAPLVRYAQGLEDRIEQLEERLEALETGR